MAVLLSLQDQRKGIALCVLKVLKVLEVKYCFGKMIRKTKGTGGFVKHITLCIESILMKVKD